MSTSSWAEAEARTEPAASPAEGLWLSWVALTSGELHDVHAFVVVLLFGFLSGVFAQVWNGRELQGKRASLETGFGKRSAVARRAPAANEPQMGEADKAATLALEDGSWFSMGGPRSCQTRQGVQEGLAAKLQDEPTAAVVSGSPSQSLLSDTGVSVGFAGISRTRASWSKGVLDGYAGEWHDDNAPLDSVSWPRVGVQHSRGSSRTSPRTSQRSPEHFFIFDEEDLPSAGGSSNAPSPCPPESPSDWSLSLDGLGSNTHDDGAIVPASASDRGERIHGVHVHTDQPVDDSALAGGVAAPPLEEQDEAATGAVVGTAAAAPGEEAGVASRTEEAAAAAPAGTASRTEEELPPPPPSPRSASASHDAAQEPCGQKCSNDVHLKVDEVRAHPSPWPLSSRGEGVRLPQSEPEDDPTEQRSCGQTRCTANHCTEEKPLQSVPGAPAGVQPSEPTEEALPSASAGTAKEEPASIANDKSPASWRGCLADALQGALLIMTRWGPPCLRT